MKKIHHTYILLAFLSPLAAAEDWSEEQKEVLAWEEECISASVRTDWLECFHEDFVGWGNNYPAPTTKPDREKRSVDGFESFKSDLLLFKPISVQIYGNTAVINYIDTRKNTNKTTNEVTYNTSHWTDVAIKEGGNWYWIADHGSNVE